MIAGLIVLVSVLQGPSPDSTRIAEALRVAIDTSIGRTITWAHVHGISAETPVYVDLPQLRRVGEQSGIVTGSLASLPGSLRGGASVLTNEEAVRCSAQGTGCQVVNGGLVVFMESMKRNGDQLHFVLKVRFTERRSRTSATAHVQYRIAMRRHGERFVLESVTIGSVS